MEAGDQPRHRISTCFLAVTYVSDHPMARKAHEHVDSAAVYWAITGPSEPSAGEVMVHFESTRICRALFL